MTSSEFIRWGPHVSDDDADVRTVDGSAITDKQSLLREIASALNFPAYFGQNWDAFEECLRDVAEFNPPGAATVVVTEAETLRRRLPREFETLLQVWADAAPAAAREGSQPHLVLA